MSCHHNFFFIFTTFQTEFKRERKKKVNQFHFQLQIVETYNDKKYENSSGIHSGGSDLDSSCHIEQKNSNFILNSRCSSTELKSEYSSAFNERFRSPSMKVKNKYKIHFYISIKSNLISFHSTDG